MTEGDLQYFKRWFSEYTGSFREPDEEDHRNIELKVVHSENVCRNITAISAGLRLSPGGLRLAQTVALFHDLGRFPQYARYRTFSDRESVNHGTLGAETLTREGVLSRLPEDERTLIAAAVKYHNVLTLPALKDRELIFFLKLVRDADKLDALRILLEYYEDSGSGRTSATVLGLPDLPEYSPKVLAKIVSRRMVTYSELASLHDFQLLNLSWCYLLHFQSAYRLLHERGYIQRITGQLPDTEEIREAVDSVRQYVEERLRQKEG